MTDCLAEMYPILYGTHLYKKKTKKQKTFVAYLKFKLNGMPCIFICSPISHFQGTILPCTWHPLKASGLRYNNDSSLAATTLSKCYILVQVHRIGQITFFLMPGQRLLKKINEAFKINQKDRLNYGVLALSDAVGT